MGNCIECKYGDLYKKFMEFNMKYPITADAATKFMAYCNSIGNNENQVSMMISMMNRGCACCENTQSSESENIIHQDANLNPNEITISKEDKQWMEKVQQIVDSLS